jgi:hypothetical protein
MDGWDGMAVEYRRKLWSMEYMNNDLENVVSIFDKPAKVDTAELTIEEVAAAISTTAEELGIECIEVGHNWSDLTVDEEVIVEQIRALWESLEMPAQEFVVGQMVMAISEGPIPGPNEE